MSEDDIMEFTKRTGLTIFEASAKTGHGVESSFIALAEALIDKAVQNKQTSEVQSTQGSTVVGSHNQGTDNPYDQPFDESKIKMKRIQGRGGLSSSDKALMLCC